ncbi:Peptidase C14 caspase catalytic [Penicillium canariense]|uniref:Peptidase C14 caspase catalytic n=1 Tax=Penicillium canariense TaxID=189055 RepID=A0A9W9HZQ5_9EURO|nr:Peptidase C14 caspase catalytic [Penicillium canariense]KAJ5160581.1 Peptidase C14 caspase catalytic [Penicillium canariense]
MASTKRALLIASPYGDLQGPENDVEMMSRVLQKRGFQVHRCCGSAATRDGIRSAWKDLICQTASDDTVVIYYSGHGGEALSSTKGEPQASSQPWRLQFIVPIDYQDGGKEFRGISEVELSQWLLDTTDKTHNVTVILDCCHSGRMVRDPRCGKKAIRKNLPTNRHHDIAQHIKSLRQQGFLRDRNTPEGNPHAVRIAAAAPWESAYEYENDYGERVGALTEALVRVIEETKDDHISWKTVMFRVQELVNISFAQQHPRVEGPQTRFLFALDHRESGAILITEERDKTAKIKCGRVAGVREKNIYAIMPPGSEKVDEKFQIATATVVCVSGFDAAVTLTWKNGAHQLPREGALAFLIEEALYKWPAVVPEGAPVLRKQVELSKFIRCCDDDEVTSLVEFRQEEGKLTAINKVGIQFFSQRFYGKQPPLSAYRAAVHAADQVARAQHFLVQSCDTNEEQLPHITEEQSHLIAEDKLQHDLEIKLGLVQDSCFGRIIDAAGDDAITENSSIFIYLRNTDERSRVFVSIFEVEVNGQINALNGDVGGIDLPPGRDYTIGSSGGRLEGLKVKWPNNIPRAQAVVDTLVLVLSSAPVDLRFLISTEFVSRGTTSNQSSLGGRLFRLGQGASRLIETERPTEKIRYDMIQLPFLLKPLSP